MRSFFKEMSHKQKVTDEQFNMLMSARRLAAMAPYRGFKLTYNDKISCKDKDFVLKNPLPKELLFLWLVAALAIGGIAYFIIYFW